MNKLLIGLFVQLLVTPLAFAEWVDTAGHEVLFIEMEDTTQLEVLDWGGDSTPTLFLLAGMASNAHTYDEFATHFTDEFRVVALSRIGHGYSEPPKNDDFSIERLASDIVRTLDSLGIEKAIFAGHSFAGFEGLVDQIRTEGKIAPFPPGVSAPFRSQASQGVLIY
ncbi:alpha/beta fold hydrolase [Aliidiomarina maris]|uniref:Alpha/beta hydrolase family protein n=1 Tax=Aliidiomarina maris TaxID=531312 RepID=A0A327X400_9GAMM|nr:alpha/beta fold hydrolase [Aliidiomarina maris]RAK01379.1 alpha/beta hydrolase family protein [Aliidiomarina maris]RUO28229.1 hypothetical protein CWE07_00005 [Aliidiomarina maris]